MQPDRKTPATVLTGFLGSGKTTLLSRLLRHPDLADTAIIINEFGEVGLDHILVEALDQEVVLLPRGCVCCATQGDLAETLRSLHRRRADGEIPDFRRIVIETSGLADPAPVMQTFFDQGVLALGLYLDRVLCVVDGAIGAATLDRHEIAIKQAAVADVIVVSKTDMAQADDVQQLCLRLTGMNRHAVIHRAAQGEVAHDVLLGAAGRREPVADSPARHLHDHLPHDHIHSISITSERPLSFEHFRAWLERLVGEYGEDLLRTKGILSVSGEERPVVIHGVQHVFHPLGYLPDWPHGMRLTRLVVIARDIDEKQLASSFERHVLAFSPPA